MEILINKLKYFLSIKNYPTFVNVHTWVMISLVAQMLKNLPVMWETEVWSLGWEDPNPVYLPEKFHEHWSLVVPGVAKCQTWLSN